MSEKDHLFVSEKDHLLDKKTRNLSWKLHGNRGHKIIILAAKVLITSTLIDLAT